MRCSKQFRGLLVGVLAGGCGGVPDEDPSGQVDDPIINGVPFQPAANAAFSGVVQLDIGAAHGVGSGILLRNDWVITARHNFFSPGTPPTRVPNSEIDILAPGRLENHPNGQSAAIDRVLFHRLGPRLDVALVHLDGLIATSAGAAEHKLSFFQGPFSSDPAPSGLVNSPIVCFGYGRTALTGPASERLLVGTPVIQAVNTPTPAFAVGDNRVDGSLSIYTRMGPGPLLGQMPHSGDSGGPCFFGPALYSTHIGQNDVNAFQLQVDAYQSWVEQILFEIAASEFNDATTNFTAGSDMLFRVPTVGTNVALEMNTRPGGPNGQNIPVADFTILIDPVIPPVLVSGGFTFQVASRGIGEFNGDEMSDIVATFDTNDATGQPVRFVAAYMSNGSNPRAVLPLFSMTNSDGWEIASIADLDADGLSDILWRNALAPGFHAASFMGRTASGPPTMLASFFVPFFPLRAPGGADIPGTVDPAWRLVAAGDFDRGIVGEDNRVRDLTAADLLWHNQLTGAVEIWSMGFSQGNYVALARFAIGAPRDPARFEIVAFGDYTRDGTPDIVWRDRQTTGVDVWILELDPVTGSPIPTEIPVEVSGGGLLGVPIEFEFVGPR